MNAISFHRHISRNVAVEGSAAFNDVGACIKSWGMVGLLSGGLFGFALGAVFVAIPFSSNVLSFGFIGTLLICTVECAFIAGGFGAIVAALCANGVLRANAPQVERTLVAGRLLAEFNLRDRETPVSEWPARWAYPGLMPVRHAMIGTDTYETAVERSWTNAQAHLCTVEACEIGNTAP